MGLNDVVEQNYNGWLMKVKTFVPENEAGDVLDSVILSMLERGMDADDLECVECYVLRACKLAFISKNSPYNRQLENHIVKIGLDEYGDGDGVVDEPVEELDFNIWDVIANAPFSWWEKEVFKRKVLENKTLQEMADETNLSVSQVWYSYNKVRKYLQTQIKGLEQ